MVSKIEVGLFADAFKKPNHSLYEHLNNKVNDILVSYFVFHNEVLFS